MSFFLLYDDHGLDKKAEQFCGTMAERGFVGSRNLTLGRLKLVLFGDQSGTPPAYHSASSGDFVAVLGSLLYQGQPAPTCLPKLLEAFEPNSFVWEGLLGSHVILIKKADTLYLCGDGLGACRIYHDEQQHLWSNSFLAMLELTAPSHFDNQACYEYVINGSVFGQRTLVEGISSLPANTLLSLSPEGANLSKRPSPISNEALPNPLTLDNAARYLADGLKDVFTPIAAHYGDRIRLSFSGGFDSRLMLAMLLAHDAKPTLFVYGDDNDEDVRIARTISQAENLPLETIDKSRATIPDDGAAAEEALRNLYAFDAWKVETHLFDQGVDRRDRLARHNNGQVPLNGSLGEIYRNFFYMPDRSSSASAIVSTFYSRYDPAAFTNRFDEASYRNAMTAAIREAIGADTDCLSRSQVEEVYPKFRGRFWTGRDAQINQRFGPMFFPYLEPIAISNTAKVPIHFKDLGYLQGRMIAHINPRLADYPSDYGFALNGKRPLSYRLKSFIGTQRPAGVRKHSFRLTHRHLEPRTGPLSTDNLARVIDPAMPIMSGLFRLDGVKSADQFGLIASLEYIGERYDLRIGD